MGVVYRAKDPVLNREVAIKLIPPGNLTANAEERFLREAQIVAQMDHPAIVPIYDRGRHEGALFFVMPVLPGTNLRHLLRDGSLRLGDVLDIGMQVAEALDYSHARGIVHRDIKPENVMTSRDDAGHVRARVMDFGLALAASEDRLTKTGTLVGTVSYFSPEQVTSRAFDGRTDTYALGTMLYECLAGEPPFSGEVQTILYRIVNEVPQSLRATGADVSEELESAILQCLEKDPEKRPKKAIHLAEALRRYRGKLHEDEYTRSVMLTASRMVTRPQAAASPFIGREKETTELQRRLHAAVAGECQFAVVAGEPGIGKTRLLEQLHGAEQSAEALQYVVRRLAPTPTLIVGSYRQTEVEKRHPLVKVLESFRGDPRFVSITLGPLSPSEHRSLVELSAGGGKLNDALASRLYQATEGNPFFTKELVRSLVDSGGIARDDTGALNLSGAAAISADVLPETIQQAVEARIERLPEDAREILSVASVLGKSFEYRDLEALSEDATGLDESVERLVKEGLLEEQRESRGDVLGFASGIVRDVLYGQLSRRRRRSLHKAFGERLESQNAEQLELVYPDLVHHFSQGDVPEKTVDYGLKLAKKSLDAFSPEEATRPAKTTPD